MGGVNNETTLKPATHYSGDKKKKHQAGSFLMQCRIYVCTMFNLS